MTCQSAQEAIVPHVLGELARREEQAIREHFQSCEGCRAACKEARNELGRVQTILGTHLLAPEGMLERFERNVGRATVSPRRSLLRVWTLIAGVALGFVLAAILPYERWLPQRSPSLETFFFESQFKLRQSLEAPYPPAEPGEMESLSALAGFPVDTREPEYLGTERVGRPQRGGDLLEVPVVYYHEQGKTLALYFGPPDMTRPARTSRLGSSLGPYDVRDNGKTGFIAWENKGTYMMLFGELPPADLVGVAQRLRLSKR